MTFLLPPDLMASVSGFRGRVGEPLTPELVARLAAAFGAFLREEGGGDRIFLGRDSRTSGPMLARAATAGLESVGCRVTDLGIVPTPTLMLAVREAPDAAGGVGVTASHNPAEWNALKLAGGDGTFLDGERSLRFRRFLTTGTLSRAPWNALGRVDQDPDAIGRHLDRILALPLLDPPALRDRAFRVVVDCVHGAGGRIMPHLLEALGCEVTGIGVHADGLFPRDPEPTAANLSGLGEAVRTSGADLGMAVDPDVDRLSLVDGEGSPLGEDFTLALAADTVLRRTPGAMVTNLSTSQLLDDVAAAHRVQLHRTPVGEIHVARRIEAEGAVVGGEGNGGVILPALHLTRDAPAGAALILQHLLELAVPLKAAAGRWPSYRIVKEKVPVSAASLEAAYRSLEGELAGAEVDRSDGLRLGWREDGRWLHLRPSGTEPVVRIIAEGRTEADARALVDRTRDLLAEASTVPD